MNTTGCCPESRCPALQKAIPGSGKVVPVSDFEAYLSGPPDSKRVIIVIADIFGFKSGRHFGICDHFAENGYHVIMPDLMKGAQVGNDFATFLKRFPIEDLQQTLDVVYDKLIPPSCEMVGMIGFCMGSWIIFHESKRNVLEKFSCGVNCHPSVAIEGLFGRDVDALSKSIKHPMLLIPTKGDHASVQKGTFLESSPGITIIDCSHQAHGFVSQGDVETNEQVCKDVLMVMNRSLEFFAKY